MVLDEGHDVAITLAHERSIEHAAHIIVAAGATCIVELVVQRHAKDRNSPPQLIEIPMQ